MHWMSITNILKYSKTLEQSKQETYLHNESPHPPATPFCMVINPLKNDDEYTPPKTRKQPIYKERGD